MTPNLQEQFALLPTTLGNHLQLTVVSMGLGMLLSLPLAVVVSRRKRWRATLLGGAAIIQTIPGLALLALMVPMLAAAGGLTRRLAGFDLPVLGFVPTVLALTLYSMLPMLRNTVAGLTGVDPDLTEAARALGMTPWQILRRVELPVAAPVILAGVRTALVWVVGTATLATPVGQVCLGNHIFMGLQTRNWTAVLFGCVAAATLALILDGLAAGLETAARRRNRRLALACVAGLVLLVGAGLAAPRLAARQRAAAPRATPSMAATRTAAPPATGPAVGPQPDVPHGRVFGAPRPTADRSDRDAVLAIGAKTFTEQYILADLIDQTLTAAGFSTRRVDSLGSTIIFDALATGDLDIYVDYSGTIWANHMHRGSSPSRQQVLDEMTAWLRTERGIVCLGSLGFENAYALALPRSRAAAGHLRTIEDLAPHAPDMRLGGDYEFFGRPEWRQLAAAYGLKFAAQVSFDSTFMYDAVRRGAVDIIAAFSSDGRIAAFDLQVLADPLGIIPPYDAVLLLSAAAAARRGVAAALQPLLGNIDVATMRQANNLVDRDQDKYTVHQAATWLRQRLDSGP
ncbi:MAG: ABC transporter permease/substrate-binding protein [Acidobacteriota bacterium]